MPASCIFPGVLKQAAGKSDFVGGLDGERSCGGATEVVHSHWSAEVLECAPADNQVDGASCELPAML